MKEIYTMFIIVFCITFSIPLGLANNSLNAISELTELYELYKNGVISKENFNKSKKRLLEKKTYSTLSKCKGSLLKTSFFSLPNNWHNCHGTFIFTDEGFEGNKYVGEFRDGKFHGQGNYTFNDGSSYSGEWKNGEYHDQGTYTWANGDKYIGEHKNGKRHGQGTYTFNDGRVWDGQWKDGEWISGKKYAKGEYKGSVVADSNNLEKNENQKAVERERKKGLEERRKREELERELAELKIQKKKEKDLISSDIDPPQIIINSTNVQEKKGTIKGKVSDNIEVAELTIDGKRINFSNNGSFSHNLFIPQEGVKVSIEATDNSGLTTKEIVIIERNEVEKTRTFSFAKLNPLNIKGKKNKNSIALIVGISKYNNAPEAKYADRDANYFHDFAENVLGITDTNIKLVSNNSANNVALKKALKIWLKGYSEPNQSDIYIFFAGHGLASTDGKELYLLPYDGEPRLLEDTALLRSEIFETLQSINPKSVTIFLDACYSGQTREKDMILADARPIAIVPMESDIPENFTVFSASSGSEISGSLPEADHGLFSYFLMKGLEGDADANNDKKITNGELHSYVRSNVSRQAVRLGREQTPQLQGDENRVLVEFK